MGTLVVEQPEWNWRQKTWNRDEKVTVKAYYRTTPTGPWVYQSQWEAPVRLDSGALTGTTIPDFHKKERLGVLLPHTKFELFSLQGLTNSAGWYIQTTSAEGNKYDPYAGWLATYAPSMSELSNRTSPDPGLVQRAAAKIWSRGWDMSTFFAELSETVKMFVAITDKIRKLRSDKPYPGKKFGRDIEDFWLEGRYGWRPLLHDLKQLEATFGEWQTKLQRVKERCRFEYEEVLSSTSKVEYYYGTLNIVTTDTWWYSKTGSVSADIFAGPISSSPVMTLYEKLKYSFVLDWILNVGQAIAAASLQDIALRTTSSAGYAVRLRRHVAAQMAFKTGYTGLCHFDMNYEAMYKYRYPIPVPTVPRFGANLNLSKVIDSILFLKQLKR